MQSTAKPSRGISWLIAALIALSTSIIVAGIGIQLHSILRHLGVADILSMISLPDVEKIKVPLYLTFSAISILASISSGIVFLRRCVRWSGYVSAVAAASATILQILPHAFGYPISILSIILLASATIVLAAESAIFIKLGRAESIRRLTSVELAATASLSAMAAVLTAFTGSFFPSPTGGYTNIGDTAIFVAALLYGSRVGGLVGAIGPLIADLIIGYPRWFVTIIAHGGEGLIAGLGRGRSLPLQAAILFASGVYMATMYFLVNVFIKGLPVAIISYARDIFGQTLFSTILALLVMKAVERMLPHLVRKTK
ncbi:MAG: ECF transporter S component [Nitrososphaerota archaeon]